MCSRHHSIYLLDRYFKKGWDHMNPRIRLCVSEHTPRMKISLLNKDLRLSMTFGVNFDNHWSYDC